VTSNADATMIGWVDQALDKYVKQMRQRGVDPVGVRADTLAKSVGIDRSYMSTYLQVYRERQRTKGDTRYVIGSEGYGRAARWRIQSKPDSDPKAVRKNRKDHAKYVARDNVTKLIRDYASETHPALGDADVDKVVRIAIDGLVAQTLAAVDTAVALIELGQV
jgi:hypothetical protein